MGWLTKLTGSRKKARPVGHNLEKGRVDDTRARRVHVAVKSGILLALVAGTLLAFPRAAQFGYTVQEGDEWQQDALVAPFEFAIFKDPSDVETERAQVRYSVAPLFRRVPDAMEQLDANRDTVAQQLGRVYDAFASYQFNQARGRPVEAAADSLRVMELRRNARLKMTPEQWQTLLDAYARGMPELSGTGRFVRPGPRVDQRLLQAAHDYAAQLLNVGVLDVPLDTVLTDDIRVRNERENTEIVKDKGTVFGWEEAFVAAEQHFRETFQDEPELASLANALFRTIIQPSLTYLRAETLRERRDREGRIRPTRGRVAAAEVIVREGELITPEIKRKLESLEFAREQRSGKQLRWRILLGQLALVLATYLLFFLYLFLLRRQVFDDNGKMLLVAILFGVVIALYALAVRVPTVAMYAVPVAVASVLLTVVFDSRVGIFGTLTLALLGAHLLRFDFEFAFATIFAGALGVFSVRDIKNRGQFFVSAGVVFIGYVTALTASWLIQSTPADRLFSDFVLVAINSFLLIIAYPLLWVFERGFNVTTDLTLLELSDTNRPVLKELSLRAPGTFNHVLQVANLAEAAADNVGANALLTRVGALYHDLGKMQKPEYFVENQRPGDNPHDQLKPRMSALIIASHVKEGLEIGRDHKLPQRVLDFIPMHHGTTRIEYFYRKAQEQRTDSDPQVLESEFRYPGPRPNSKETGILMLADSVEAASRSLANPTHKRLETLIDMIIRARTEDDQLSDTELTFRDLDVIKETFLSMLAGIYHVRVKYPGQEVEDKKEEKQPETPSLRAMDPETARPTGDRASSAPFGASSEEDEAPAKTPAAPVPPPDETTETPADAASAPEGADDPVDGDPARNGASAIDGDSTSDDDLARRAGRSPDRDEP